MKLSIIPTADPFGGDPFKETDPFKASSEDFFKKTTKLDPFSTPDPFSKSATLPSKVLVEEVVQTLKWLLNIWLSHCTAYCIACGWVAVPCVLFRHTVYGLNSQLLPSLETVCGSTYSAAHWNIKNKEITMWVNSGCDMSEFTINRVFLLMLLAANQSLHKQWPILFKQPKTQRIRSVNTLFPHIDSVCEHCVLFLFKMKEIYQSLFSNIHFCHKTVLLIDEQCCQQWPCITTDIERWWLWYTLVLHLKLTNFQTQFWCEISVSFSLSFSLPLAVMI